MRRIYIYAILVLLFLGSCSDELDTQPTGKVPSGDIFEDAESMESAINGIYRMMYAAGWSASWAIENFGQTSINLVADLMGEDHLMAGQGQGWFYYDYALQVHGDYTTTSGRSYSIWNYYYTLISNANYIIDAEETVQGDAEKIGRIVAEAYAVRALSYYYLVQIFQQTYNEHEDAPGVPVYILPTTKDSEGKGRGTVQAVYTQINKDIEDALSRFSRLSNLSQSHKSHIDYYVAQGLKARFCLTQHLYPEAAAAAAEALKQPGLTLATVSQLGGNNSVYAPGVMWGMQIIAEQSTGYASFFSHMDADGENTYAGKAAQQCISAGLYNLIPDSDERKGWFRGKLSKNGTGSNYSYCQIKFKMVDYATWTGDYLLMRAEEMILIKAEAECHQGLYGQARLTIRELGEKRDAGFANRLAGRTDAKTYNSNTNASLVTLMDEILFQRRLELWGETGRVFDLQRLGLSYDRNYTGSNHTVKAAVDVADPLLILPLPQKEIDGNENISAADQNEIVM